jgi:hypothetical protein
LPERPAAFRRGAAAWPLVAADVVGVEVSVAVMVAAPFSVS